MTDKQKIAGLCFGLSLILAGGFGWNWFLDFNICNQTSNTIHRLLDNQDDFLFIYGFFADKNLTEDQKSDLKRYIEVREPVVRSDIEYFKKKCRSRRNELIGILKGYEIYLYTKHGIFKESQASGFQWIRDTFPYEPSFD